MLTSRNAEGVHGQRKVGNPCARSSRFFWLFAGNFSI